MKCGIFYLVFSACLLTSCTSSRVAVDTQRDLAGRKVALVRPGTSEAVVLSYLGQPSEVRTNLPFTWEDNTVNFAYGSHEPGQFAEFGTVVFDKSNRVIRAISPTRGCSIRPGAEEFMPWLDRAYSQSNILCVIKDIKFDPSVPDYMLQHDLRYSLVNRSNVPCDLITQDLLKLDLVVEVYDERKSLFFRTDYGTTGTREFTIKRHLPPRSSVSGDVRIWVSDIDFGRPPPGTYYVRIAFGLDDEHFSVSKAVKFKVP
jgi:hypothetical protein